MAEKLTVLSFQGAFARISSNYSIPGRERQEESGQYTTCSNPLKTSFSKTFRICATPGFGGRAFHSWCDKGCSPKFQSFTKNTNPFALLKNTSINKI
jgi:hypothetical protein